MKAVIFNIRAYSKFHFGDVGIDNDTSLTTSDDVLHSDSLFAAIIKTYADYGYDPGGLIRTLSEKLSLSSLCYCLARNNNLVYFFPKPLSWNIAMADAEYSKGLQPEIKRIKAIQFLSQKIIETGLDVFDDAACTIIDNRFAISNHELGQLGLPREIQGSIYKEQIVPHVKVSGETDENSYYNQGNIEIGELFYFNDKKERIVLTNAINFYFLVDGYGSLTDPETKEFDFVLSLFPETGIGGDRNNGSGYISSIQYNDFQFNPGNYNAYSLLSVFIPADIREWESFIFYRLITRGGRMVNEGANLNGQLKQVMMLQEGSVTNNTLLTGKFIHIEPAGFAHPFLRFGKPVLMPVHKNLVVIPNE